MTIALCIIGWLLSGLVSTYGSYVSGGRKHAVPLWGLVVMLLFGPIGLLMVIFSEVKDKKLVKKFFDYEIIKAKGPK